MYKLPPLNLPKYSFRFKKSLLDEPLIFDSIRKKWLVLTSEEWVRQNLIRFLVQSEGFPESQFKIETGVKINGNQKRSDILIYKNGVPAVLVECKALKIKLDQSVLDQALNYNQKYNCNYILISNGIQHIFFYSKENEIIQLTNFPKYKSLKS